jgi:hypothetical protein
MRTFLILLTVLWSIAAHAQTVRYGNYKNPSRPEYRSFNKIYLKGVSDGLVAYNASMIGSGKKPLFCLPPKLALTGEQAADILVRTGDAYSNPNDIPISIILLIGLEETFPCKP